MHLVTKGISSEIVTRYLPVGDEALLQASQAKVGVGVLQ